MSANATLLILDDCSETIDHAITLNYFPDAIIHRTDSSTGRADYAIGRLWKLFLQYDFEYLVNIDSDMIVCRDLIFDLNRMTTETEGIFSLFNTPAHKATKIWANWVEKESFGSAGTVIRRDIVERILTAVPISKSWDWDWCKWLRTQGVTLVATRESQVQHLGLASGQNTTAHNMGDFGERFNDYNESNISSAIESVVEVIKQLQNRINKHEELMIKMVEVISSGQK